MMQKTQKNGEEPVSFKGLSFEARAFESPPLKGDLGGCSQLRINAICPHPPKSPFKGGFSRFFVTKRVVLLVGQAGSLSYGVVHRRVGTVGYILFETMIAMMLLSMGMIGLNRAMQETIVVRGLARDNTQARFMLEDVIAMLELQPQLIEASGSGQGEGENSRFSYKWTVSKVDVPEPPIPPNIPPEEAEKFELSAPYLAKIEATVSWERSGRKFEQTAQTLWTPEKLFIPKEKTPP